MGNPGPNVARKMAMFEKGNLVEIAEYEHNNYLKTKDAAMVLFYSSRHPRGQDAKSKAIQASVKTNKPNHAYVAVDCSQDSMRKLCTSECFSHMPTYKLYSRGVLLGSYERDLSKCDLIRMVEDCPVKGVDFARSVRSRIGEWNTASLRELH